MVSFIEGDGSAATIPTINDVARAAGVSTATVSRALSAPGRLRPSTRALVLNAVRSLGYTPNQAARTLRAGASKMVLVVVPQRKSPPFFADVLEGIDAQLCAEGYTMIMGALDGGEGKARRLADLLFSRHLDGVIIVTGDVPMIDGRSILDAGVPVVSVCAELELQGFGSVVVDDEACAMVQTQHLIALGHRRLMYVAGPPANYSEARRYRGFLKAVQLAGIDPGLILRQQGDFEFSGGVAAAERFLTLELRPTGIVCASDEMAIGFIKTITQAGVKCPADVSVSGFDGISFADFCEPTLTTICQPRFELGATGARLLLEAINGKAAPVERCIVLQGQLLQRASTGPAPDGFKPPPARPPDAHE